MCFLAFHGHCYMQKAVKRALEGQTARVLYRGKARQTLRIAERMRLDAADVQSGLFWCENLREARRRVRLSEAGHKDSRAVGGCRGGARR